MSHDIHFLLSWKDSGVSTEYIEEALGYSDIKTTENYLDSFEKEIKKEYASRLTSFKDEKLLDWHMLQWVIYILEANFLRTVSFL